MPLVQTGIDSFRPDICAHGYVSDFDISQISGTVDFSDQIVPTQRAYKLQQSGTIWKPLCSAPHNPPRVEMDEETTGQAEPMHTETSWNMEI